MLPWLPNGLDLLKAKLSRYIAGWVFASIVLIELVILVPSYFRQKQELLRNLESVSTEVLKPILSDPLYQRMTPEQLLTKVGRRRQEDSVILGFALYSPEGTLLGTTGEAPALTTESWNRRSVKRQFSAGGDRYDVAWPAQNLKDKYLIIVRHNSVPVRTELIQFLLRIALLVMIIAIFVTLATMLALGMTVIAPIVRLRNDLIAAGEAISQDTADPAFQTLLRQRNDELGEVFTAFHHLFQRVRHEIATRQLAEDQLRAEQAKAEELLLNILPEEIATQLKQDLNPIASRFDEVTILFADIVQFTELSARISAVALVEQLNQIFSTFDRLTEQYGLEKIKTIGDAYMVVGGLPTARPDHAIAIAQLALAMQTAITKFCTDTGEPFRLRIGINSGPVVAGVIGLKKFSYDLWGDAVNLASRMESHGGVGKVQVTETTYHHLKDHFCLEPRGPITVKGRGEMMTYWLVAAKPVETPWMVEDSPKQPSPLGDR